jgi:hypothetical protein
LFIYQHIFNEVNRLCDKYGIHLVNILAFDREKPRIDISSQKGAVLYNMTDIMNFEINHSSKLQQYIHNQYDIRHCHMNPHNNNVLSDMIVENFSINNALINIAEDSRLDYDEKHCDYFFNKW